MSFPKLVAAVAAVIILPSQTYALENTYLPVEKVPYYEEMPDQPHRLGPLWGKRDVGPAGTLLKVPGMASTDTCTYGRLSGHCH